MFVINKHTWVIIVCSYRSTVIIKFNLQSWIEIDFNHNLLFILSMHIKSAKVGIYAI